MISEKSAPRLLGFMFVFVALASLLSGLALESFNISLIGPPADISETMIKASGNPATMQMSIVGFLFEACGIVLLAVLLYTTLKAHDRIASIWALGLWVVQAAFVAVRQISSYSLLKVSQEYVSAGATGPNLMALGRLFYGSIQFVYSSQMIFYLVGGMLFYYILFRSKIVPAWLSLWGLIAASLALVGELLVLFDYNVLMLVFLPILPFELAIGLWLMVKGVRDGDPS